MPEEDIFRFAAVMTGVTFKPSPGGGAPSATLQLVVTNATPEQMEALGLEYGEEFEPASGLDGVFVFQESSGGMPLVAEPKET